MAHPHADGLAASLRTRAEVHGLAVVDESRGKTAIVRLVGVLRSDTAVVVREAVGVALVHEPATIVLDMTNVVAGDGLGLWVLPAMAGHTQRRHAELLLVVPARGLRRRLRRLGGHPLDIVDSRGPLASTNS